MAAPRLRVQLSLVAAFVGVVLVLDSSGVLGPAAAVVVDDGAQLAVGVVAAACCLWVSWRVRGVERVWRRLMAVGMAGWSVGQLIWSWYQIFASTPLPSPAWSDVGYLTLPVFGFAALLALAMARDAGDPRDPVGLAPRPARWVLILDGLVVVGSLFMLTWDTALGAVVRAGAPNRGAFVVAIAYPLTDLVMVVMAVLLLTTRPVPVRLRPQVALLGLGVVGLALSDSIYAYVISSGAPRMPPIANAGFVAGPALVALAALTRPPSGAWGGQPGTAGSGVTAHVRASVLRLGWAQLFLPYVPLAVAGALVADRLATGYRPGLVEVIAGVTVLGLVVFRQMITLVDNHALLRRVSAAQEQLVHQAFHDALTGLANRSLFADRLTAAVGAAVAGQQPSALLFIDLDEFKAVNDSLGHGAGDQVLRVVAGRLRGCVGHGDTVARLGGDEFGVLLAGEADHELAGERILAALDQPFWIEGQAVRIRASVGVAVAEAGAAPVSAQVLMRRADAAMYAGKRRGKGPPVRPGTDVGSGPGHGDGSDIGSGPGDGSGGDVAALLARELTDGSRHGLCVWYQPIVALPAAQVVAVEALVRWSHPDTGPVPAAVLVALAEQHGLIGALDNVVLDRSCRDLAAYRDRYGSAPRLHVNVSPSRLGDRELDTAVQAALDRHGLTADQLLLEVTETQMIPDLDRAVDGARRLRQLGVGLALDDFGTGHNTLIQAYHLPVEVIKLDRTLTAVGPDQSRSALLCASVVALAAGLGATVIAEGIETLDQQTALVQAGCRYGQGYRYGRPAPLIRGTPATTVVTWLPGAGSAGVRPVPQEPDLPGDQAEDVRRRAGSPAVDRAAG